MYILHSLNRTREASTLQLPDFPPISDETLEAIDERHNLRAGEISPLEDVGIFNAIYLVGSEYVLRIPRYAPDYTKEWASTDR